MGKDLKGKELGRGLYQRKDGRYEGRYFDVRGKRRSVYGRRLKEVRLKLSEAVWERERLGLKKGELSLDEWFEVWVLSYKKSEVRETTLLQIKGMYEKHIKGRLGAWGLGSLKPMDIQGVLNDMAGAGYSASTVKRVKCILNDMLKRAEENEYIAKNPCRFVKSAGREKKKSRCLTEEEIWLFLKYGGNSSYYDIFRILLLTGMRSGEALALKWSDIDFDGRFIDINKTLRFVKEEKGEGGRRAVLNPPKTKSGFRKVPMGDCVFEILAERKKRSEGELVFPNKRGKYADYSDIDARIKEIIKKIRAEGFEIGDFSLHSLRHTFTTRCLKMRVGAKSVQKILGHSGIETTLNIYSHLREEEILEEVRGLRLPEQL